MTKKILLLITVIICTGCIGTSISTEPAFLKQELKTGNKKEDYRIVYKDENIIIKEMFLGLRSSWDWDEFVMPEARIPTIYEYIPFEYTMFNRCYEQYQNEKQCSFVFEAPTTDGDVNEFEITFDKVMGGNSELRKNNNLIWEGHMNGGTGPTIRSIQVMNGEIVIDYIDVDQNLPVLGILDTILLTQGDSAIDFVKDEEYTAAFAPNEFQDGLTFFGKKYRELFLVHNGRGIELEYDDVFNQYCCWDGPPIQISCNGEIIDFFAWRDDSWYHVQVISQVAVIIND